MIIKNGAVFEEDGTFRIRDIYIEDHKIAGSREALLDTTELDASGLLVLPGEILPVFERS